ncbi:MAG TPA: hypothetical protein VFV78_02500 [Vicinamibacterales bacterium]|nr:hypothetical protein [Vicinamibacterales bacterium]
MRIVNERPIGLPLGVANLPRHGHTLRGERDKITIELSDAVA